MSPPRLYSPFHYDLAFRLKVPIFLWLIMIYGLRHLICMAAPVRMAWGPVAELLGDWRFAPLDLPILLVMYANGARVPEAKAALRRLWHSGRAILTLVYFGNASLLAFLHNDILSSPNHRHFSVLGLLMLIDVGIIAYLLKSQLIRDLFADFPESIKKEIIPVKQEMPLARRLRIQQGELLLEQHPLQSGEEALRMRLPDNLEDAPVWHALGILALQSSDIGRATAFINHASLIDGTNPAYLRDLCDLKRRQGMLDEAIRIGKAATQLDPSEADGHFYLGLVWMQSNRPQEAIACYREAVRLNPQHATALNNLGVMLRLIGQEMAAREAFAAALKVQPGLREAQLNIAHGQEPVAEST